LNQYVEIKKNIMTEQNLYYPLWIKYLPIICVQIKNAANGEREINLSKFEFEAFATRKAADNRFNLEIKNGKISNDIRGAVVARDLFEVLNADAKVKELLQDRYVKIYLEKDYVLRISILESND